MHLSPWNHDLDGTNSLSMAESGSNGNLNVSSEGQGHLLVSESYGASDTIAPSQEGTMPMHKKGVSQDRSSRCLGDLRLSVDLGTNGAARSLLHMHGLIPRIVWSLAYGPCG